MIKVIPYLAPYYSVRLRFGGNMRCATQPAKEVKNISQRMTHACPYDELQVCGNVAKVLVVRRRDKGCLQLMKSGTDPIKLGDGAGNRGSLFRGMVHERSQASGNVLDSRGRLNKTHLDDVNGEPLIADIESQYDTCKPPT